MISGKIDLHTHILPRNWQDLDAKFGYRGFARLEHYKPCCARMMIGDRFFREITDHCWEPARRIEDCDRCGVAMQVLSTLPVMFSYWAKPADGLEVSLLLNDHIAGVVRDHPGRFAGLGTIPLQDPELACRELERCVRELGLAGVEIGTHVEPNEFTGRREAWNLNDAPLDSVFDTAAELGAAIFVHPWNMMGKERMPKYWLPWLVAMPAETSLAICSLIFGGTFERLPNIRIAFAHGGGSFPGTVGRIHHGFKVRPDLCAVDNTVAPREYLAQWKGKHLVRPARFYVDSLVHDEHMLMHLVRLFGPQRVALGSDYPFPLGEPCPGELIESMTDLSEESKMAMLAGAAREFLSLPVK
jgi:aminocarboxymuconate-semialdehyde decarboxylase